MCTLSRTVLLRSRRACTRPGPEPGPGPVVYNTPPAGRGPRVLRLATRAGGAGRGSWHSGALGTRCRPEHVPVLCVGQVHSPCTLRALRAPRALPRVPIDWGVLAGPRGEEDKDAPIASRSVTHFCLRRRGEGGGGPRRTATLRFAGVLYRTASTEQTEAGRSAKRAPAPSRWHGRGRRTPNPLAAPAWPAPALTSPTPHPYGATPTVAEATERAGRHRRHLTPGNTPSPCPAAFTAPGPWLGPFSCSRADCRPDGCTSSSRPAPPPPPPSSLDL